MPDIRAPIFHDADKGREYLERLRWPNGPVCPHCGAGSQHYALKGTAHRPGLWKCKDCRKQFSVTIGTVFERSKIPLSKWLLAVHLMCASEKVMNSHEIHRRLGVTYKSAWLMAQRIREAMEPGSTALRGADGGAVEAEQHLQQYTTEIDFVGTVARFATLHARNRSSAKSAVAG